PPLSLSKPSGARRTPEPQGEGRRRRRCERRQCNGEEQRWRRRPFPSLQKPVAPDATGAHPEAARRGATATPMRTTSVQRGGAAVAAAPLAPTRDGGVGPAPRATRLTLIVARTRRSNPSTRSRRPRPPKPTMVLLVRHGKTPS